MNLRPYQEACIAAIRGKFRQFRKLLAVVPTGGGKTVIFSFLTALANGRVLIVAHREELIRQAAEKLHRSTGIVAEIDRAEEHASLDAKVVVGSVQTLCRRFQKYPPGHFSLIIIDEAHHALADSYQGFLQYFMAGGARVLGVTATPGTKGKKALGNFFEDIAYEVGLLELIKQGFLAPLTVRSFPLEVSLTAAASDMGRSVITQGDYDDNVAAHALEPYLDDIAAKLPALIGTRKTIVFLPLIATVEKFVEACRRVGITAEGISGQSENRADILARHGRGFQVLANSMLLTEGYDDPEIQALIPLRPTRSDILFSQMVGRGTRMWCPQGCTQRCDHPGRKENLLLLDPLWLHEDLQLVRPASLVTGNDEERRFINKAVDGGGGGDDLLALLGMATAERESSLAARLAQNVGRKQREISVEEWSLMTHSPDIADFEPTMKWHSEPPTESQLRTLARFRFGPSSVKSKGQASALIDSLFGRIAKHMATPAQIVQLKRHGHPAPATATFEEANRFITQAFSRFEKRRTRKAA